MSKHKTCNYCNPRPEIGLNYAYEGCMKSTSCKTQIATLNKDFFLVVDWCKFIAKKDCEGRKELLGNYKLH